jgi:hypothetical protein
MTIYTHVVSHTHGLVDSPYGAVSVSDWEVIPPVAQIYKIICLFSLTRY